MKKQAVFSSFLFSIDVYVATKKFHLLFTVIMGTTMVTLMTFVITLLNVGLTADFLLKWAKAYVVAYVVALPIIYFLAPMARKLTAKILKVPA